MSPPPDWRSLLFVAADDAARIEKVTTRGADAIILDLEDAVPPARKVAARIDLAEHVTALVGQSARVVVRINAGWGDALADMAAAVVPGVAAIMVPKVEDAERLRTVADLISEFATDEGLAEPPAIIALIESPLGLQHMNAIARVPEVIGLALGSEDFSLALRVPPSPRALDLPCRLLALAAAPRELMALGLPVSIAAIGDMNAWQAAVEQGRAIGITGALCVHPAQVAVANAGFAPSPDAVAEARRIVGGWEAASDPGVLQIDGRMIDRPVVEAARRTIARAGDPGERPR